jgi:hypothetical protein
MINVTVTKATQCPFGHVLLVVYEFGMIPQSIEMVANHPIQKTKYISPNKETT